MPGIVLHTRICLCTGTMCCLHWCAQPAEVLGSAIALNLLTGMPLWAGVLVTAADVFIMMLLELRNFRALEVFVMILSAVITACFIYELAMSKPDMGKVMKGFVPTSEVITNQKMLYIATGVLRGCACMPTFVVCVHVCISVCECMPCHTHLLVVSYRLY